MASPRIFVYFDLGATSEEVELVQAAFDEAGVDAEVSGEPYSLTASGSPEVVEAFAIVATTAASAFSGRSVQGLGQLRTTP